MGAKRKVIMTKGEQRLEFESIASVRRHFGMSCSSFELAYKHGNYKGWAIEIGETPYHGMHSTSMYSSWAAMKTRCTNPNIPHWNNYGGRGIKLFPEWYEFKPFMEWAYSHGWKEGLTIERIDVNGDYCPENCCWITKAEQSRNTRMNVFFTIDGEKKTLTEWARQYGIPAETVKHRLRFGWDIKKALTEPQKKWPASKKITYHGKTMSARQWSQITGLKESTIAYRINHGWTAEDALTVVPDVRNRKQTEKIA